MEYFALYFILLILRNLSRYVSYVVLNLKNLNLKGKYLLNSFKSVNFEEIELIKYNITQVASQLQVRLPVEFFKSIEVSSIKNKRGTFNIKCYDEINPNKAFYTKIYSDLKLIDFEVRGYELFSKYTPKMSPQLVYKDKSSNFIITDVLDGYESIRKYIIDGNMNADVSRQIGTVMGRNHARSHYKCINSTLYETYHSIFGVQPSYLARGEELFGSTLQYLSEVKGEEEDSNDISWIPEPLKKNISQLDRLIRILQNLHDTYKSKKECLIHGNLLSANVLINSDLEFNSEEEDLRDSSVKVVNFEHFSLGPAGVDLGVFLLSHMWYYAVHTNLSHRRRYIYI